MDKELLENLKEGSRVELKKCESELPSSFWRTYSGFANADGGTIYLGVSKAEESKNDLTGVKNHDEIVKEILVNANDRSKVSANLLSGHDIEEAEFDGKHFIAVHVRPADIYERPVFLDGNPYNSYRRDGEADHKLTESEAKSAISVQIPFSQSHDFNISPSKIRLEELDGESLKDYRGLYNSIHSNSPLASLSDEEFFCKVGALRKENGEFFAANAGLLTFGTANLITSSGFPNFFLDFSLSDGQSTKWDERVASDDLSWSGNLFCFVRLLNRKLPVNLSAPFHLQSGANVGNSLLFGAVREAILNAVFNADYSLPGGIKVSLTPREVLVRNPGYMMVPLDRALQGGFSNPRNPGIATIFRSVEYGDRAGSGIPTMFSSLHQLSYPAPIYREDHDLVATSVSIILLSGLGEAADVLRAIVSSMQGQSTEEIMNLTHMGRKKAVAIIEQLMEKGLVVGNGNKTKGKRFLKAWRLS